MSTAQDFILLDFGVALTKGFLLTETEVDGSPQFEIKDSVIVPTTVPNLEIGYSKITKKFSQTKKVKTIITSSFLKKEAITSFSSDDFVDTENSYKALKKFFGRSNLDILFLDAGSSNWLQNFDTTLVSAFTPSKMTELEIENYLGNKRRYLFSQPLIDSQTEVEVAFLKNYLLTRGVTQGNHNTLVVASGGMFSYSQDQNLILETIVDKLTNPFCQILLDTLAFLPSFGAFLTIVPEKMEILQVPGLKNLAAVVNIGGPGHLEIEVGMGQVQKIAVGVDQLTILPAERDREVIIKTINKEVVNKAITVGEMGVVIDGRVKPLDLVPKTELAKEKIKKWREVYSTKVI